VSGPKFELTIPRTQVRYFTASANRCLLLSIPVFFLILISCLYDPLRSFTSFSTDPHPRVSVHCVSPSQIILYLSQSPQSWSSQCFCYILASFSLYLFPTLTFSLHLILFSIFLPICVLLLRSLGVRGNVVG
jgi:hypothetical protein